MDAVTRVDDAVALAAYVQSLVHHYSGANVGRARPLPPVLAEENKWRAARYGLGRDRRRPGRADPCPSRDTDRADARRDRAVRPRALGCEHELLGIADGSCATITVRRGSSRRSRRRATPAPWRVTSPRAARSDGSARTAAPGVPEIGRTADAAARPGRRDTRPRTARRRGPGGRWQRRCSARAGAARSRCAAAPCGGSGWCTGPGRRRSRTGRDGSAASRGRTDRQQAADEDGGPRARDLAVRGGPTRTWYSPAANRPGTPTTVRPPGATAATRAKRRPCRHSSTRTLAGSVVVSVTAKSEVTRRVAGRIAVASSAGLGGGRYCTAKSAPISRPPSGVATVSSAWTESEPHGSPATGRNGERATRAWRHAHDRAAVPSGATRVTVPSSSVQSTV